MTTPAYRLPRGGPSPHARLSVGAQTALHSCIEANGVLTTAQKQQSRLHRPVENHDNRASEACCVASGRGGATISGGPIA